MYTFCINKYQPLILLLCSKRRLDIFLSCHSGHSLVPRKAPQPQRQHGGHDARVFPAASQSVLVGWGSSSGGRCGFAPGLGVPVGLERDGWNVVALDLCHGALICASVLDAHCQTDLAAPALTPTPAPTPAPEPLSAQPPRQCHASWVSRLLSEAPTRGGSTLSALNSSIGADDMGAGAVSTLVVASALGPCPHPLDPLLPTTSDSSIDIVVGAAGTGEGVVAESIPPHPALLALCSSKSTAPAPLNAQLTVAASVSSTGQIDAPLLRQQQGGSDLLMVNGGIQAGGTAVLHDTSLKISTDPQTHPAAAAVPLFVACRLYLDHLCKDGREGTLQKGQLGELPPAPRSSSAGAALAATPIPAPTPPASPLITPQHRLEFSRQQGFVACHPSIAVFRREDEADDTFTARVTEMCLSSADTLGFSVISPPKKGGVSEDNDSAAGGCDASIAAAAEGSAGEMRISHALLFGDAGFPLVPSGPKTITYTKMVAPAASAGAAPASVKTTARQTISSSPTSSPRHNPAADKQAYVQAEEQPGLLGCRRRRYFHMGGGHHGDTLNFDGTRFLAHLFFCPEPLPQAAHFPPSATTATAPAPAPAPTPAPAPAIMTTAAVDTHAHEAGCAHGGCTSAGTGAYCATGGCVALLSKITVWAGNDLVNGVQCDYLLLPLSRNCSNGGGGGGGGGGGSGARKFQEKSVVTMLRGPTFSSENDAPRKLELSLVSPSHPCQWPS